MTNPMINPQPNYSGVTIQISNPAVNVGAERNLGYPQGAYQNGTYGNTPYYNRELSNASQVRYQQDVVSPSYMTNPQEQTPPSVPQYNAQAYPPQYYLNNYNYQANGTSKEGLAAEGVQNGNTQGIKQADIDELHKQLEAINKANSSSIEDSSQDRQKAENNSNLADNNADNNNSIPNSEVKEEDMSKSNGIINDLDSREAKLKADEKNSKQKRVVALTDEYIKSLENYLNNPNDEIRLMASKDVLKRLDEDKTRYDDAALNALLNKMLQDPSKVIRVAALSAFASQLASGNDYTVQLLHNIQANPNADKEDVLQAADILLKMSGGTEIKNIPNPEVKENNNDEKTKG